VTRYRISWIVDVDADNPEDAVNEAHNKYIHPTALSQYNVYQQDEDGDFNPDDRVTVTRETPSVH